MPFDDLFRIAQRIARQASIPFSVDIEGGYSRDPSVIVRHIEKLYHAGVAGINIEDSLVTDKRSLNPVSDFQKLLASIQEHLIKNNIKIFVNVRTDTFLLGVPAALPETLVRIKAYEQAGANGIFVPCITSGNDIKEVVSSTTLPVNVLCMPDLPSFETLAFLGVKRISMGNFVFDSLSETLRSTLHTIREKKSFSVLFR
jgi:2-methylisocitrate lyase-like PEP mutase family enzyme